MIAAASASYRAWLVVSSISPATVRHTVSGARSILSCIVMAESSRSLSGTLTAV
jgi:hypothetical protein